MSGKIHIFVVNSGSDLRRFKGFILGEGIAFQAPQGTHKKGAGGA
jgi:hypothetical protein